MSRTVFKNLVIGVLAVILGLFFFFAEIFNAQRPVRAEAASDTESLNATDNVGANIKRQIPPIYNDNGHDSSVWISGAEEEKLNYNCYSFAIEKTDQAYNPGDISGQSYDIYSVSDMARVVAIDLSVLGHQDISYGTSLQYKPGHKIFCMRINKEYGYFHFMKYESGTWYHKQAGFAILKYKYEPEDKEWLCEIFSSDWGWVVRNYVYDSEIYYVSYIPKGGLFAGGSGTSSDPYLIETERQFMNIGLAFSQHQSPSGYQTSISDCFRLRNNLVLSGATWSPFKFSFSGVFDGGGNTISYTMTIQEEDLKKYNFGLFGAVTRGGRITNLVLDECVIRSNPINEELGGYAPNIGILAGSFLGDACDNVKVKNCKISCNITAAYVGGIAGLMDSATNFISCVVSSNTFESYKGYLGGMVGESGFSSSLSGECESNILRYGDGVSYGFVSGNEPRNSTVVVSNCSAEKLNTCLAAGTLITLADGSQVPVESLTGDELLLVWNFFTGEYDVAPIIFIDRDSVNDYKVISLNFSDGTVTKVIYEHGFWDYDLNEYVYLDENAAQYIGHWFHKQGYDEAGNITSTRVQLTDVNVEYEYTTAYSPVTYGHLCYFVNGMLSIPGGIEGLFNIFEVDAKTMKYDEALKQADIERYGLFTYEEFFEIFNISEEMFHAFGGQYLKVSVGKGLISLERIGQLIERYADILNE